MKRWARWLAPYVVAAIVMLAVLFGWGYISTPMQQSAGFSNDMKMLLSLLVGVVGAMFGIIVFYTLRDRLER